MKLTIELCGYNYPQNAPVLPVVRHVGWRSLLVIWRRWCFAANITR